jgi:hypothetical protein
VACAEAQEAATDIRHELHAVAALSVRAAFFKLVLFYLAGCLVASVAG